MPEIGTLAWLSMMFCAGIGAGILVYSVSEPLSHFSTNLEILSGRIVPRSQAAVGSAMRHAFLHWGLSAWACYAVAGLALGLAAHRFGQPLTMRSTIASVFGRRLAGVLGRGVDILSILAIVCGTATTVVLAMEQAFVGLAEITGLPAFSNGEGGVPVPSLLLALGLSVVCAVALIASGVNAGVRWVSHLGGLLATALLAAFVLLGAGAGILEIFVDGTLGYLAAFPAEAVTLYDATESGIAGAQRAWQETWTVFYWAWWISFAPFVGVFLARVSRGRTIREFILGAVLCPTIMCFFWFSATGGSALMPELDGHAGGALLATEHTRRVFRTIEMIAPDGVGELLKIAHTALLLILVVACVTAAVLMIALIAGAGQQATERGAHPAIWALVIAAVPGAVIVVGGTDAIRCLMIVGTLPFSGVLALMIPAILRMIWSDATSVGACVWWLALGGPLRSTASPGGVAFAPISPASALCARRASRSLTVIFPRRGVTIPAALQSPRTLAITPAAAVTYADIEIDPDRGVVYAVMEEEAYRTNGQAKQSLVALGLEAKRSPRNLAIGGDFYAAPRLPPSGQHLAWITWNYLSMPWEGTELWLAEIDPSGAVRAPVKLGGGSRRVRSPKISIPSCKTSCGSPMK
ncbi:MAG: BCCT family transporter [Pseudomonadota bacterium]